jgi:hypothetical protein
MDASRATPIATIVMPTQVGIHVFLAQHAERRRWPAFADHDDEALVQ